MIAAASHSGIELAGDSGADLPRADVRTTREGLAELAGGRHDTPPPEVSNNVIYLVALGMWLMTLAIMRGGQIVTALFERIGG